jgi:hypothetical protein
MPRTSWDGPTEVTKRKNSPGSATGGLREHGGRLTRQGAYVAVTDLALAASLGFGSTTLSNPCCRCELTTTAVVASHLARRQRPTPWCRHSMAGVPVSSL